MPAFASILTGRYPREHGAVSLKGFLDPQALTLAEILREAGYRTGGVVSHWYVDSGHGFAQGFDRFSQENARGHLAITSAGVTDEAERFLEDKSPRPFFLFVHYFDPHFEYRHHPRFDLTTGYQGWLRTDEMNIDNLLRKRHLMGPDDIRYLTGLYDEEIAYTDLQIGRLLDFLEARGLGSRTLVVLVSDHGEEFLERGWLGHTVSLHEELIHVPLIIRLPGRPPVRPEVERVVETRAIFPTILEYVGLTDASPVDESGLLLYLYDLSEDPGETKNLAATEPSRAEDLRRLLDSLLAGMLANGETREREIDKERMEALRALGYL